MQGGGGEAPPPSNGGEYLLQLLRNPHHAQHSEAAAAVRIPQATIGVPALPPPLQSLSLDPAVAAVGRSVPFPTLPSNGYDLSHPWPNPHNYLIQGVVQNPWSSQSQFIGNRGLQGEDVRILGFDARGKTVQHQQQQQHHQKLMFGSFPCDIQNHGGSLNGTSLENPVPGAIWEPLVEKVDVLENHYMGLDPIANLNSHRNASQQEQERASASWGVHQKGDFSRSAQPPGFPSKPRGVGNFDSGILRSGLEGKVNKGNVNEHDDKGRRCSPRHVDNHDNVSALLGVSRQLQNPGLPAGSNLHSVLASEIEDSLLNLHAEIDGVRDRVRHVKQGMRREEQGSLDALSEEMAGSLVLENGSQDKHDIKQHHNSRDRVRFFCFLFCLVLLSILHLMLVFDFLKKSPSLVLEISCVNLLSPFLYALASDPLNYINQIVF